MKAENSHHDLEKTASNSVLAPLEKGSPAVVETSSEHTSAKADRGNGVQESVVGSKNDPGDDGYEYPSTKKLIPLMGSLYIAFFLISLVRLPSPWTPFHALIPTYKLITL